jgi:hypothetical protein
MGKKIIISLGLIIDFKHGKLPWDKLEDDAVPFKAESF